MARDELVQQIRYSLHSLSSRNGHHEFEALCLEVARQNVTAHVLPSTGPVSAGGDQGRDFETFFSRATPRLGSTALFLGVAGDDQIAFACTIQRRNLDRKIRDDVSAICDVGEHVDAIVVYCEADIPTARRHVLQADVYEQRGVRLEIIDGRALADQLAQPSLFWAAVEHLAIPAQLAPETASEPDAYRDNLHLWRERAGAPVSFGDFLSLRDGLRDATLSAEHRADSPFWLSRMALLSVSESREISWRATYELILGTLRGLGHLRGEQEARRIRVFLDEAKESEDEVRIADAATILLTVVGARMAGLVDLDGPELMARNRELSARVGELLAGGIHEEKRCRLLETLGVLRAQPDISKVTVRSDPENLDVDRILQIIDDGPMPIDPEARHGPLVDVDGAVNAWVDLARRLEANRLYPVEALARGVAFMAPLLFNSPNYEELVALLDEAVGRVAGQAAVAERCRDRALGHYKAGRIRDALTEFHRTQVSWLHGDTMRGAILAQIFIAECYLKLELHVASRYFWLVAARLASRSPEYADLVPGATFGCATTDYYRGAWFSAVETLELAFQLQMALAPDPWDTDRYDYLGRGLFELIVMDAFAGRLDGPAAAATGPLATRYGAAELLQQVAGEAPWWHMLSTDEFTGRLLSETGHAAFEDGGSQRVLSWRALGISWTVASSNDFESVAAAEALAAILQVGIADLSRHELAIAPGDVRITVELIAGEPPRPEIHPSNEAREWRVWLKQLGSAEDDQEFFSAAIQTLFEVLADVSMLPAITLNDLVRTVVSDGLIERFAPMLSYQRANPISRDRFDQSNRGAAEPTASPGGRPIEHPELAWPVSPGPGFDELAAREAAISRYDRMHKMLPYTLPRLMNSSEMRACVDDLRREGWKDWHLLLALTNLVLNYRVNDLGLRTAGEIQAAFRRLYENPETKDAPSVPATEITGERLRQSLQISMLSTMSQLGLEFRQETPDFAAIEKLLRVRYRYWEIDAPHEQWWEGIA